MLTINTWDGNNINDGSDYKAGFSPALVWGLPEVRINTVGRFGNWPLVTSVERGPEEFSIYISIEDSSNVRSLRAQLLKWFDPSDDTPKQLIITDDGTTNPRYKYAICQSIRPVVIGTVATPELFRITLVTHGDVLWKDTADSDDLWYLTATADDNVVANAGEADAYPVYTFEPTTTRSNGYAYRAWVPIKWRAPEGAQGYPLRAVMDTATPVSGGKMQADGDDLRVYSDGIEQFRYLNDMQNASTDIWFSLDFKQAPDLVLKTALAATGDIDSIEFTDEIEVSLLPETGILMIDSEVFLYTSRSLLDASVSGITRAAKGSSMASHAELSVVYWIQHDVYILYGNSLATAPEEPTSHKPIFELDTSTNVSWVYENFGDIYVSFFPNRFRPGSWENIGTITTIGYDGCYTSTERGALASPYSVAGAWIGENKSHSPGWQLANPCGIINAAWTNGKKRAVVPAYFVSHVRYWVRGEGWWTKQYQIPIPSLANTWESWSCAAGAPWSEAFVIGMHIYFNPSDVEIGDVTVTLSADDSPVVAVWSEEGNYHLTGTLTNEATGEAFTLNFIMDTGTELEVDTENKIVTWLEDGSRQYQAISLSSKRSSWLRLIPGNNTLRYDDVGTGHLTITTTIRPRYY